MKEGEAWSTFPQHLGGTIGDIEGMSYLAAFERFQRPALRNHLMNVHVSLVMHPNATGEPKTKPMQNSVRHLRAAGLVPDLLICRSSDPLQEHLREKIAAFGLVDIEQVIGVHDVSNIYKVPLLLQEQHVLDAIIHRLHLKPINDAVRRNLKFNMCHWTHLSELCDSFTEEVVIALVGKYVKINDAYASVNKALTHAAIHSKRAIKIKVFIILFRIISCYAALLQYVDSELLEDGKPSELKEKVDAAWDAVKNADGIIVPGGFDKRGVEGMIKACRYARENNVPFLGVCLGMQCAAIEVARNLLGIENANSTEFNKNLMEDEQSNCPREEGYFELFRGNMASYMSLKLYPEKNLWSETMDVKIEIRFLKRATHVIIDMPEHNVEHRGMGGTMRLGRRTSVFLTENCKLRKLYGRDEIEERHRHRYEVNPRLVPNLSKKGLLFVGMGVDETTGTVFSKQCRTQSSAALMKLAEDHAANEDLISKITDLCHRGGDGVTRPALRMEMCEMK
ncbi:unnamed protein product, partial [Strongylus vulgaris]